ncbi:MAG: thiamine phosphate synthase [Planctomycetaceae bacterium]
MNHSRLERLTLSTVYVLISEAGCCLPWQAVVEEALRGGADVLQLREKHLPDNELLQRADWMADRCRDAGALLILNDRPDLAAACNADGVHLGQEDVSAEMARQQLQPDQLLGLSTHNLQQLQAACRTSVSYLGVGPVFPSSTKDFDSFAGLSFVREAAQFADRPWFAIGGISAVRLPELTEAGASRIAVSAEVIGSPDPAQAVRQLKVILDGDRP